MEKLRVWWVAQAPCKAFYVPVKTVEEGKMENKENGNEKD